MYDVTPITSPKPTDCGATCLKMMLNYYGLDADLNELIKECRTSVIGCSARDILNVGRKHGMDMKAYQADAESLLIQDRPAIIWWMYQHFVVFCGVDEDGKVVICNPDRGRYRISKGTFKSFYTGVELTNGESGDLPSGD